MKKIFATVLFLGAVLHMAPAAAGEVTPGFLLGINLGKISGWTSLTWGFRPGILFGGYLNFSLNKVFSFEPQLYFTQKGAQRQEDVGMGVTTTTIALSYIEVPLLLKIAIPLGEDYITRPRIYAGPSIAYRIRGVYKLSYVDPTGDDNEVTSFPDLKRWETGVVVGAGVEFDVKGGLLTLDARYSWSLATITTSGDKRNRVLAAVIGFAFK